jgi:hypothetical protein
MTNPADVAAASFVSFVPSNRRERCASALQVICSGIAQGSILNVDFQDAKLVLDRSAEEAFDSATGSFWHGKGGSLSSDVAVNDALNEMHYAVSVHYVRDAISASKKVAKVSVKHPMVDAYRASLAFILPVAELLEQAKAVIVKGRRVDPAAEAKKAAKLLNVKSMDRATCPCCFKSQAVLPNGLVHDHGYTLPAAWNKSPSCHGRAFRPLEVASDGLVFMVSLIKGFIVAETKALAEAKVATSHKVYSYSGKASVVSQGEPDFNYQHRAVLANLESSIRHAEKDLAKFQEALASWKAA